MQTRHLIATDGGAIKNGKVGCRAAYAVFFGENDIRNCSGLITDKPSNQTGELTAIAKAIEIVSNESSDTSAYLLLTDSDYAMRALTVWCPNWIKRKWKKTDGSLVAHRELIEPTYIRLQALGARIQFKHIRSHRKAPDTINLTAWKEWMYNKEADDACSRLLQKSKAT